MPTFDVDAQSGALSGSELDRLLLSAEELGLLYWARLGAPDDRIASALHLQESEIPNLYKRIAKRLKIETRSPKETLSEGNIRLKNGRWPQPSVAWSERHAITILRDGLFSKELQDRPFATVAGEGTLSLLEVADLIARIRSGLARAEIGPGCLVALDAKQCLETMIISCAVLLQGAAVVRLAENVQASTLRDNLRAAPAQMTFSSRLSELSDLSEAGRVLELGEDETGAEHFLDWLDQYAAEKLPYPQVSPTDVALVGFTSGTTGRPKTILNTHEALWRSSEVGLGLYNLGPKDTFCSATDIVSMGSFRSMATWPLMSGGQVLFLSADALTSPLAQAFECKAHDVTVLTAVPNVVRNFAQAADRIGKLTELRAVLVESGIQDAASKAAFTKAFGIPVIDIYGKRETNHVLHSDPTLSTPIGVSGGRVMETLVRVLSPDGTPIKKGETGELYIMTDCLARDTPEVAIGAIEGKHIGWHPSGDLGAVNHDGQILVTARLAEVIKTPDGELLAPIEVETVLMSHSQVQEACVFSVVGSDGIEKVGASVLVNPASHRDDEAIKGLMWDLRRHVQKSLGRFKTPENILVVDTFPRLARDKPDQRALRDAYKAAFDAPIATDS